MLGEEAAEPCNQSRGAGRGPGSRVAESQLPARGPEERQAWCVRSERPGIPRRPSSSLEMWTSSPSEDREHHFRTEPDASTPQSCPCGFVLTSWGPPTATGAVSQFEMPVGSLLFLDPTGNSHRS